MYTHVRNANNSDAWQEHDSLSRGSYWAVHHGLTTIAELLGGEGTDPWSFSWWELEYRHTARARRELVERYAPGTVKKMLTVLRGVLKTCWRLGLMDAETYRRAADVANVRAKTLPAGRGVERGGRVFRRRSQTARSAVASMWFSSALRVDP